MKQYLQYLIRISNPKILIRRLILGSIHYKAHNNWTSHNYKSKQSQATKLNRSGLCLKHNQV
jgi:hypothetical protein